MCTLETLKPGQKGTRELLTRFGPSLLCVLSRYDEGRREQLKTVELIAQWRTRERVATCHGSRSPCPRAGGVATRQVVPRIGGWERDLQRQVKSAGGRWVADQRVWILRRDAAESLDLLARRVVEVDGCGTAR